MQREIFPLSDLWQIADRCSCSGDLKALTIGSWSQLESKAVTQCVDCDKGWLVSVSKTRISLDCDAKDRRAAFRAKAKGGAK